MAEHDENEENDEDEIARARRAIQAFVRPQRTQRIGVWVLVVLGVAFTAAVELRLKKVRFDRRDEVRMTVQHVTDTVAAPPLFAADGAPTQRSRYDRASAATYALLRAMRATDDQLTEALQAVEVHLTELDAALMPLWTAADTAARREALLESQPSAQALLDATRRLDLTSLGLMRAHHGRLMVAFGALLLALLAWFVGAGALATREFGRRERRRQHQTQAGLATVLAQLEAARAGHPQPEVSGAAGLLRQIQLVIAETAQSLGHLREAAAKSEQGLAFSHDLNQALELADTEAEVLQTAARAVALAFPGQASQIWLADNSHASLEAVLAGHPQLCDARTPHACPAIRRNRTEHHTPEGNLARCPHLRDDTPHVSCAFVAAGGRAIGALQHIGVALSPDDQVRLGTIAAAIGTRLTVVRTLGERELQAGTDVLTGLANRRRMNQTLDRLDRTGGRYAVIAADLDHFKRLNDTYGHEVGDRCLKVFAQVLRDACRAGDLPCRPGGEEFLIILPDTGAPAALKVAERIRTALHQASRAAGIAFSASLGVATRPEHGDDCETVLRLADQGLYAAKAAGRDRVSLAPRVSLPESATPESVLPGSAAEPQPAADAVQPPPAVVDARAAG